MHGQQPWKLSLSSDVAIFFTGRLWFIARQKFSNLSIISSLSSIDLNFRT